MINIVFAALSYALFQVLAGYAAQKLSNTWFVIGGAISVAFFTGLVVALRLLTGSGLGKASPQGMLLILIANAGVTLFLFFLGRAYQQFDARLVIPLVFGFAIAASTTASVLLEKAVPSPVELTSLALISGGLVLLGIAK